VTRDTFNFGMAALLNAFTHMADRYTKEMQEIYWLDLKDVPDEKFQAGVSWCRHHLDFFPSIAKLGSACYGGNANWHEEIVNNRRLAMAAKAKRIDHQPMTDEQRKENQRKIMDIARNLGNNKKAG